MAKLKGDLIYTFKKEFINIYGVGAFKEVLENLNKDSRSVLNESIISSDMYELKYLNDLLKSMMDVIGKSEFEKFCEDTADKQMFFWGFLIKIWSLDKILHNMGKLWGKAYDVGTISRAENIDNKIFLTISDFYISEQHMITLIYYFKKCAEKIVGKPVNFETNRVDETTTEFIYSY